METLEQKIRRVVKEHVAVVAYDPRWPKMFRDEKEHLLACLPHGLIKRIEQFGSTAVPGLAAKPIVDMLIEVTSLDETRKTVPQILESQGYDYFWRPTWGDDTPPFYAWFIKCDADGKRTHHIHMVEAHFEHWDRLLFRDYLVDRPEVARQYGALKVRLSETHGDDRVAYTKAKTICRTGNECGKGPLWKGRREPQGKVYWGWQHVSRLTSPRTGDCLQLERLGVP